MNADSATPWSVVGGDYSTSHVNRTTYAPIATWEEYNVIEIVTQFFKGTPNYGFIVIPDLSEGNTGRDYISSELEGCDSLKPKLTITYVSNALKENDVRLFKNIQIKRYGTFIKILKPQNDDVTISIYNVKGRLIEMNYNNHDRFYLLYTETIPAGLYFLKITVEASSETYKLIIGD